MAESGSALPRLRPDYRRLARLRGETRAAPRLLAHYQLERRLAHRLLQAPRDQRAALYTAVYAELFAELPDHPQHAASRDPISDRVSRQVSLLRRWMPANGVYLEIGCGDAAVTFAMAVHAGAVYGLDVTDALVDVGAAPPNFGLLISDGVRIPLGDRSVDLAYSNQLMEHLHPEDAVAQLREVVRVLRPGGAYLCITPNAATGPHDISGYFGRTATGFHLREYSYGTLRQALRQAGFRQIGYFVGGRPGVRVPYLIGRALETALRLTPSPVRIALAHRLEVLFGLNAIARC